jgi:hypothetical protein
MAVHNDPLQIKSYETSIPTVQIPPEAIGGIQPDPPLQGQFGRKGTGALMIGDALMKGFLQGHAQKAQQKAAEAQATLAAGQQAEEALYARYQDALTQAKGNVNDPTAQAAYKVYQDQYGKNTEAMARYALPEKGQKGKKSGGALTKDTDPAKSPDDKKPKSSHGFDGIKEFLAANPHIVPQLALTSRSLTMRPQGLSAQGQTQNLELASAQREQAEAQQKIDDRNLIASYGKMTPEEIKALPADVQKQLADPKNGLAAAKARWEMDTPSKAKYDTYVDENGNYHSVQQGGEVPAGWKLYAKPTANGPKGEEAFVAEYVAKNKLNPNSLDPNVRKYLHDVWLYRNPQTTSATSSSTVDVNGNRTTTNTSTRGSSEPKPPAGFPPVEGGASVAGGGGMAPPPGASGRTATGSGRPAASGGMTRPPTLTQSNRDRQVSTQKNNLYEKAEARYNAALSANAKKITDPELLKTENARALDAYNKEKAKIVLWNAEQIRAIGGDPYKQYAQGADGIHYGTMDGKNWVNIMTGEAYIPPK